MLLRRTGLLGLCLASRTLAFTPRASASLRASKSTSQSLGSKSSPSLGSRLATVGVRLMSTSDLTQEIEATISANKVVVYSKSYCPFCARTKDIFDSLQASATSWSICHG